MGYLGLTGTANSGQLVPADDCNVTVIIEDITLLPGYGDKQVGSEIDYGTGIETV